MSYYLVHSGKGHDDNPPGRGSGRYAFGSGKRPHQRIKKSEQKHLLGNAAGRTINAKPTIQKHLLGNAAGRTINAKPTIQEMQEAIKNHNIEREYNKAMYPDKLNRARDLLNESSNALNRVNNSLKQDQNKKAWERMDLSKMSDQELRDRINRENLEIQYSKLFNTKAAEVSRGKAHVEKVLDVAGDVLAATGSIVGIAAGIKLLLG